MSTEARDMTIIGGETPVEEMVRKQTAEMKQIVMDTGGTAKYVVFGMNFQVFLASETSDNIDLQPISDKMCFTFQYNVENVISLGLDSDRRIGETAYALTAEILKQLKDAFHAGKLDEHRPEVETDV